MFRKIGLGILLAGVAYAASATPTSAAYACTTHHFLWFTWQDCRFSPIRGVVPAPEIDPASAGAGLTLLIGGVLVMRGRRKGAAVASG